jgi:hypothetical protein
VTQLVEGATTTINPQNALSATLHSTAQAATDFVIDTSGGFKNILQKTQSMLSKSLQSRWSRTYDFTYILTHGLPEVSSSQEAIAY